MSGFASQWIMKLTFKTTFLFISSHMFFYCDRGSPKPWVLMLKRPNDLDDLGGTPMTRGNLPSRQRNGHDCQTALRPSRDAECTTDQAVLAGSRSSGAAESSRNKVVSPKWQWEIPKTMGFNTQNGLMTWMILGYPHFRNLPNGLSMA